MNTHPPAFRLDARAAGDETEDGAHVESCAACTDYVAKGRAAAKLFAVEEAPNADAFVRRLAALRPSSERPPKVVEAGTSTPTPQRWSSKATALMPRAAWIAGPLLLAAALVFVVRGGGPETTDAIAPGASEPAVRSKGKLQLAVVRDRGGDQVRVADDVRVRSGDRLRVEVGVDAAQPIEVGFLGNDGTWVVLLAPAFVEAGTHFSERAASFDDTPTEGWIIAGRPDAVTRAKMTRAFEDVRAIPVHAEP